MMILVEREREELVEESARTDSLLAWQRSCAKEGEEIQSCSNSCHAGPKALVSPWAKMHHDESCVKLHVRHD